MVLSDALMTNNKIVHFHHFLFIFSFVLFCLFLKTAQSFKLGIQYLYVANFQIKQDNLQELIRINLSYRYSH